MALFALFKAQAGFPSPSEDYLEPPLSLDEHLIDNPPATFFVRVAGSSMQGLGICDGDSAVVDRTKVPKHGDVVVAYIDGQFVLKELAVKGRALSLKSHSPGFPLLALDEGQGNGIWGVAVGIARKL